MGTVLLATGAWFSRGTAVMAIIFGLFSIIAARVNLLFFPLLDDYGRKVAGKFQSRAVGFIGDNPPMTWAESERAAKRSCRWWATAGAFAVAVGLLRLLLPGP